MANQSVLSSVTKQESTQHIHGVTAVLIATYISEHFDNDFLLFSQKSGVPTSQLKRWVNNNAVLAGDKVYLQASKLTKLTDSDIEDLSNIDKGSIGIDFKTLLDNEYKGSQTLFAEKKWDPSTTDISMDKG